MITGRLVVGWSIICGIAFSVPAVAQQPTVANRADSSGVHTSVPTMGAVVVHGTRLSDVDPRTPASVDQLDLRYTRASSDGAITALEQLPGVALFNDQGAHMQPELELHGFTVSPVVGTPQGIGVFLDGVRVNEPDAQEVNFDLLPMAAVDRASLVRGSDALFGRNALGGTLLLFTRRGGDIPESTLELGMGSFGERDATLTAGGRKSGIDGFIMAQATNVQGWRQETQSTTRTIFATVGHRSAGEGTSDSAAADSSDIALSVLYAHDQIFEAGSLPDSIAAVNPRFNYTPGDAFRPDLLELSLRVVRPAWGGTLRTTVFDRRNDYAQFNANVPPPNSNAAVHMLSLGGTAEWTRSLILGSYQLALTLGGEYSDDNTHFLLSNVTAGLPDSITTAAKVDGQAGALFAREVFSLTPALTVTGALRADYVRIPYRDQLDVTNDGTSTYRPLLPQVGVTYQMTNALQGFVAYSRGFRAPAPLELACASPDAPCSLPSALGADPALRPVTTDDYEAGVKTTFGARSHLDADLFWTDVHDDIQFASPDLTHVYFINVPKTRRAGVETSGEVGLPAGGRLFASYAYVAATYQSTVQIATADTSPEPARPGDIFPSSPLHRARVGVGVTHVTHTAFLDGEFDLRGYSSQYLRGDESNQRPQIPGYAVASFRGRATWRRYGVTLTVDNLFNRRYSTFGILAENSLGAGNDADAPVVPFVTPAEPRRMVLSVSIE